MSSYKKAVLSQRWPHDRAIRYGCPENPTTES